MIIWLTSYPRSGSTLIRTILKRCLNLNSFGDEPVHYESQFRDNPEFIGHVELKENWQDFYKRATESSELFLVKTHLPPCDNQPFIYVVRDGRAAIRSYKKFHRDFNGIHKSLAELILGNDAYGDWSNHYQVWLDREVERKLLLRYENLVNISSKTLMEMAGFLKVDHNIKAWENPVEELKTYETNTFNQRHIRFEPDSDWTPAVEYLFSRMHGDLMRRLGYYELNHAVDLEPAHDGSVFNLTEALLETVRELTEKNSKLFQVAQERMGLIHHLKWVCDERLKLINELDGALKGLQNPGKLS